MNLVYFSNVWPQSSVSAASHRVFGMLYAFVKNGSNVDFICASKKSKETEEIKQLATVRTHYADPGNLSATNALLNRLKRKPDVAIFDTFSVEEKFSHFMYRYYPECMRVVDLQDLHSLRIKRGEILKARDETKKELCSLDVMRVKPDPQDDSMIARELASMYRSDLVITCSDYEEYLLREYYGIKHTSLVTFFKTELNDLDRRQKNKTYALRKHFVWLGNFNHPPNLDAAENLLSSLWQKIHQRLPNVELHIYGSNYRKDFSQLDQLGIGLRSMGLLKDLESLGYYRAMLAPLRFGAGIKGKICDAFYNHLPCVTTPIGSEGMFLRSSSSQSLLPPSPNLRYWNSDEKSEDTDIVSSDISKRTPDLELIDYYQYKKEERNRNLGFGGLYSNYNEDEFAESCERIYNDQQLWEDKANIGYKTVEQRMSFLGNEVAIMRSLNERLSGLQTWRRKNHIQAMTWNETLRSREHLAKYVSLKEANRKEKQ